MQTPRSHRTIRHQVHLREVRRQAVHLQEILHQEVQTITLFLHQEDLYAPFRTAALMCHQDGDTGNLS